MRLLLDPLHNAQASLSGEPISPDSGCQTVMYLGLVVSLHKHEKEPTGLLVLRSIMVQTKRWVLIQLLSPHALMTAFVLDWEGCGPLGRNREALMSPVYSSKTVAASSARAARSKRRVVEIWSGGGFKIPVHAPNQLVARAT